MGVRAQVGHMLVHWGCTLASALTDLNAPATPGHAAAGYAPAGRHGYAPAVLRDTWLAADPARWCTTGIRQQQSSFLWPIATRVMLTTKEESPKATANPSNV